MSIFIGNYFPVVMSILIGYLSPLEIQGTSMMLLAAWCLSNVNIWGRNRGRKPDMKDYLVTERVLLGIKCINGKAKFWAWWVLWDISS